jgi:predicted DNA-binding protein
MPVGIQRGSMKRTTIWLDDEQKRRLEGLSKKTAAPVSALIRKAIEEYLKKQK